MPETARLRLVFLAPLLAALLLVVGIWVLALYFHERAMVAEQVANVRFLVERMYFDDISHEAAMLEAVAEVIGRDDALRVALARGDRADLLRRSSPLFNDLRRKFGITHFYFSRPDRVNLLRVHQPDRHGDTIDRFTTLEAERTGGTAYGVELGPLGTFTLRLVVPWRAATALHRLLGYVELGMEIDHALAAMQRFLDKPLLLLVAKEYLNRRDWEAGMRMLGRVPEWDRFPDSVLSVQASEGVPSALVNRLGHGLPRGPDAVLEVAQAPADYRAVFIPVEDAAGRRVARLVALVDVSAHIAASHRVVYLGAGVAAVVAGALFVLFYWLVGKVGRQIERDERMLRDLANRDRLTGAWNRRMFDQALEHEMTRSRRYGTPLALIMFDIDHFKRVNDTHGHQAGDDLLAALAVYVSANIRESDTLARWGGEEFMVLAPNTDIEAARLLAEHLRALIERGNFGDIGRVTCSFGVTQMEADDTAEEFTGRADAAMYRAKQAGRNRVCRCEAAPAAAPAPE